MKPNLKLTFWVTSLLAVLISCHKDPEIKTTKNSIPPVKKYHIKSFASGISDSTTFAYDTRLLLIKKVVFAPSLYRVNGIDSTIYLFAYNNKGQLDTIVSKVPNGSSFDIGYQVCQYNISGSLSRVNELNQTYSMDNYWLIGYNSKKQVDSIAVFNQADSVLGYSLCKYDSVGNCVEIGNLQNGKYTSTSEFKYDNFNSMYQGLPICNYVQSYNNGLEFGNDYIVPVHNVTTTSFNAPGYSNAFNILYQYNKDGYPVLESYGNYVSGNLINYRITYYEK